jgi:3-oxoacyl-[acyl-carrier protein] reductase
VDSAANNDAVAIVTGGSCEPGREIARTLARRGYAVVVVYLHDQRRAEAAVQEIVGADGAALAIRADVDDELDVERLFDETTAAFGHVDVVVHAAGHGRRVVDRQAARRLRDGGAIIDVASAGSIAPVLADELRARGIAVDGVAPGLEPRSPRGELAELMVLLDRWRPSPGAGAC